MGKARAAQINTVPRLSFRIYLTELSEQVHAWWSAFCIRCSCSQGRCARLLLFRADMVTSRGFHRLPTPHHRMIGNGPGRGRNKIDREPLKRASYKIRGTQSKACVLQLRASVSSVLVLCRTKESLPISTCQALAPPLVQGPASSMGPVPDTSCSCHRRTRLDIPCISITNFHHDLRYYGRTAAGDST